MTTTRGHVSDADVEAVKAAGYDDAEVIELVRHVALNTLTNYVNTVARTDIDSPLSGTARRDEDDRDHPNCSTRRPP
jgi:hypothetical protein